MANGGNEIQGAAQLKGFDADARKLILDAIEAGCTGRVSAKGHAILRNAGRGTCSIAPKLPAANRARQNTMSSYRQFMAEHEREYVKQGHPLIKPMTLNERMTLSRVMSDHHAEFARFMDEHPGIDGDAQILVTGTPGDLRFEVMVDSPTAPPPERPIKEWAVIAGRTSDYIFWDREFDPPVVRCVACDYTSANLVGVHLHEGKHLGTSTDHAKAAAAVRTRNLEAKKQQAAVEQMHVTQAATLIAAYFGITGNDAEVADLRTQVKDLQEQVTTLTTARDELQAKFDLVREGLGL